MGREKKKGTSGNAKAFITRAKAIKKLQLTLEEFRRMCILKGVYPREPRKKLEGTDKTYYLRKDIDFLAHERLIGTLREENSHKKKVVKARAKRRIDLLKKLALTAPKARLDHLIVERYPRFEDAIRELDDPLCIVALFANLPADHKVGIAPKRVLNCQRLLKEFHNFVAETNSLKRVFVSIKGYYFQASLFGEEVIWVTPHRFSQILPADVDYSVMLTFLSLYECMMSFVNFRLYTAQNLAYPPKISRTADAKGLELGSVQIEKVEEKKTASVPTGEPDDDQEVVAKVSNEAIEKVQKMAMDSDAVGAESEDDEEMDAADDENEDNQESSSKAVFSGKSFVLGREVPYIELEFALKASGASKVTREADLPEGEDRLASYNYWIIDRPKIAGERDMSLEYVQPQYIFDSINATVLLPTSLYAPGSPLPPHLSPFVAEDEDGGYRPWFKDVLDRIKAGDTSVVAEAAASVYAEAAAKAKKKARSQEKKHSGEKTSEATKDKNRKRAKITTQSTSDDVGSAEKEETEEAERKESTDAEEESDSVEEDEVEESDDEEVEETITKSREENMDKEGKELATLMLSRKKKRQYERIKKEESRKNAVKDRLMEKRRLLATESDEHLENGKSAKRRKKAATRSNVS